LQLSGRSQSYWRPRLRSPPRPRRPPTSVWASGYTRTRRPGFCHGWSGDGAGDPQSPGKAANLRESKLDHDQLIEIIRCGVPGGTAMPHFDKFAWTKGEECFGMTEAEIGDKKPPNPTATLQKREIEAIVAYLEANIVGKGAPTVADCEEYFGPGSQRCKEMAAGRKE
jgi:hypothetical protein